MTKYNKWVVIIAIAVVAITFGLLAIPNSFAVVTRGYYQLNGYEWAFAFKFKEAGVNGLRKAVPNARCSGLAIAAMVMILLSVPLNIIYKKSALYEFLAGLLLAVGGILFLLMTISGAVIYSGEYKILWVTYVIGALLLVAGAAVMYVSVLLLRDEKKALLAPKSQEYSYLNKNENKK